jgi:hypothetical protein
MSAGAYHTATAVCQVAGAGYTPCARFSSQPRIIKSEGCTMDVFRARKSWLETVDRAYWLGHCDGFHVYQGDRHLGVVQYVKYRTNATAPDALAVRGGVFGTRKLFVQVADVQAVDATERTVHVAAECRPLVTRRRAGARAGGIGRVASLW